MADNGTVEMSLQKGNVQHSGEEIGSGYPQAQSVRGLDVSSAWLPCHHALTSGLRY